MNPSVSKTQPIEEVGLRRSKLSRLRREIFFLAWPAIMEMILHTLVWNVDTAFMGRVGAEAVAAVGAGRQDAARASASQAIRLAFACGLAVGLAVLAGAPWILARTSLPESTRALGALYMRTVALGAPVYLPAIVALSVNSARPAILAHRWSSPASST
ncbi:MAG: MATE family efflux transporter [Bacillota bacterium]